MSAMSAGEKGVIIDLRSEEKSKLLTLGILPGIQFEVLRTSPIYIIKIGYTEIAFDFVIAGEIFAKII